MYFVLYFNPLSGLSLFAPETRRLLDGNAQEDGPPRAETKTSTINLVESATRDKILFGIIRRASPWLATARKLVVACTSENQTYSEKETRVVHVGERWERPTTPTCRLRLVDLVN